MTAPTHSVFGMLTAAVIFSIFSVPVMKDIAAMGLVIAGSLLPDIDTRYSAIGRVFIFFSKPIEKRWGHRGRTHSLFALLTIALASIPLYFFSKVGWFSLILGYLSHLLIDSTNKHGTCLFWPSKSMCVFPRAERLRITTGSLQGEGLFLAIGIVLLGLYIPVSNLGLFRTIRYMIANQKSAYTDYRGATTKTLLEFKGIDADSHKPVRGIAPILGGNPGEFVIYREKRAVTYGEKGEILPGKSRVKILNEPIDIRKVSLENQPLSVLAREAGSGLVSGRLESGTDFECASISSSVYSQGKGLVFDYADSEAVRNITIHRKREDSSVSHIEENIELLENEILTLQSQLPETMHRRLRSRFASLETRRRLLVDSLSVETGIIARIDLQEEIQSIHRDQISVRSQINSLDYTDPTVSLKIQRANLKLNRMRTEYENTMDDEVLFTGELLFRTP